MGAYILNGTDPLGVSIGGLGMIENILAGNKIKVKLHTGNPTANGAGNPAVETAEKEVEITTKASLTPENWKVGRLNLTALEWPEVKENETYKWITIRDPAASGTPFVLAIELTTPVAVVKGDTFRINKEKLLIKLLSE